jgi:uncharacterized protein YjiS (DUF1127 family)
MERIGIVRTLLTSARRARRPDADLPAWPSLRAEVKAWWPHPLLLRWIGCGRACAHDRRTLAHLDDRALRDIGLDRAWVEHESPVSFWR